MSLKNLISAFAATVMLISSASMSAQSHYGSNPGLLISGSCDVSTLPQAAKKFLEKISMTSMSRSASTSILMRYIRSNLSMA